MNNILDIRPRIDPSNDPRIEANRPPKMAKFVGERENEKKLNNDENFFILRLENFDTNLNVDEIKQADPVQQLEFFYHAYETLKAELQSSRSENNALFEDNLQCGEIIDNLKHQIFMKETAYKELLTNHKKLYEQYQILNVPDRTRKTIKKLKIQTKEDSKKLSEATAINRLYKERLQAAGQSSITPEQIKQMIALRNAGATQLQIASKIGCSSSTVNKYLKQNQKLIEFGG